MLKSVLIAVSSAVVVVATGYVSLIALIVATSMQKQTKGVIVEKRLEQKEFLLVYEAMLAKLEECKTSSELAIATRELQIFEMEYPELILEYYYEEYNKQTS